MEEVDGKLSEYLLSPFKDDEETLEIKRYAKRLCELDDFKGLKMYCVQYNDTDTFNKKLKLADFYEQSKIKTMSIAYGYPFPRTEGLYNIFTKKILIFIDNKIKNEKYYLTVNLSKLQLQVKKSINKMKTICCDILRIMYHEKKHYLQNMFKDNSFDSIMCQIEMDLKQTIYGIFKYKTAHDSWYMELDANNYGTDKAIEYYKNNPQDEHVDMFHLNFEKRWYAIHTKAYDFNNFFTAYNIYREKLPFYNKLTNKPFKFFSHNKNMAWHKVLYGDQKRIKTIDEILNNPLINEIDPKFMNYVLTSKYLNRDINYATLNDEILEKLYLEFKKRFTDVEMAISDILKEKESFYLKPKDFKRMQDDLIYYHTKMDLIKKEKNRRVNNINEENMNLGNKR